VRLARRDVRRQERRSNAGTPGWDACELCGGKKPTGYGYWCEVCRREIIARERHIRPAREETRE
jgi:hypothetical protein